MLEATYLLPASVIPYLLAETLEQTKKLLE